MLLPPWFIVMWRPVYAKRVHGIGLGGIHSTYRMPTDTSTLSDSDTTRSSFESELSKRQHKVAHEREIRKALRHKLKKREHTDNNTACLSNKRHHRGAGHRVIKKMKMDKVPVNCTDEEENEFDESDTTTGTLTSSSETDDTDGSILSDSSSNVDNEQDMSINAESQEDETDGEEDETEGEEDQDVDEEEDRILAAEETALRKLNSKSSKLGGGGKIKGLKKQARRLVVKEKSHENHHRGCGLVTNQLETQDEENPVGEGRYRRRRRRRRYRRSQYPLKGTYRR